MSLLRHHPLLLFEQPLVSQELNELLLLSQSLSDLWKPDQNLAKELKEPSNNNILVPGASLFDFSLVNHSDDILSQLLWRLNLFE